MPTQRPDHEEEDLVRLYLKDIGKHALLTKDDEARLGQQIEQGVAARDRLATERGAPSGVADHARQIVLGVLEHRSELDSRIADQAPIIPVSELGKVERTILRSALFEMLYSAATPSGETIEDAVSLARIYAGDAARRLVNGVLGSVARSSGGGG